MQFSNLLSFYAVLMFYIKVEYKFKLSLKKLSHFYYAHQKELHISLVQLCESIIPPITTWQCLPHSFESYLSFNKRNHLRWHF